jgi:hypothetical protein
MIKFRNLPVGLFLYEMWSLTLKGVWEKGA